MPTSEERFRIQWDHNNGERLRRIYNFVNPSRTSKQFFTVVADMFGEGLTVTAIRRQCQKMGLDPKVSDEVLPCSVCGKPSKVKGLCMKDYKASYFQVYKTL